MRIAVIGAGIIGVTSAVALKNAFPGFEVHIFGNEFSPNTTGDGSAGLWSPYLLGDTPEEDVLRWAGNTYRWLEAFWKSGLAAETGVSLLPFYRVTSNPEGYGDPVWRKLVYGAHKLSAEELKGLNEEHKSHYKDGWSFVTYTGEPSRLLPWLTNKFVNAGGQVHKRKIREMHELIDDGYDIIINCSGLGARELIDDITVTPIRGQVSKVKAPGALHGFVVDDNDGNYVIPNIDDTVLGGTHQENDFDCSVRDEDSKLIYDGCFRIMPALKEAKVLKQWVGLRPGRFRVRLEHESLRTPRGQKFTVIHNYGHGGSGVTLCWGCALDVVEIVRSETRVKSNL